MHASQLHPTHAPPDDRGQYRCLRPADGKARLAVIATLSKGYDLDYIWKQVNQSPARDAAGYYIQASETGGEPPGRWWGPGVQALGFRPGQAVERKPYDLMFGEHTAPTGPYSVGRRAAGRKAVDIHAQLLAAEPHATAERKRPIPSLPRCAQRPRAA